MNDTATVEVLMLPVGAIRISDVKLREVNVDSDKYKSMVASITERVNAGQRSLIMPITVCRKPDPETGAEAFFINDGGHRFQACVEAGETHVPAIVEEELSDQQFLVQQLVANFSRVDQRPAEAGNHLQRLMAHDPTITVSDMARQVSQSVEWVNERLKLTKLKPEIQELVNDGEITLTNGANLAKLDAEDQDDFLDDAKNKTAEEFGTRVNGHLREKRKAAREARELTGPVFTHTPKLRTKKAIEQENESNTTGRHLVNARGLGDEAMQGWALAIQWVLTSTDEDIKAQEAEFEEEQAAKAEKKRLAEAAKADAASKEDAAS